MTAGIVVAIPWPISACETTSVTELSGSMRTQAFRGLLEDGCAEATSNEHPIANAAPPADTEDRNERRVTCASSEFSRMFVYSGQGKPAETHSFMRCTNTSCESGGGKRPGPGFQAHAMKWSVAACSTSRSGENSPFVFWSFTAWQI